MVNDRQRESYDYLNRRYDQRAFESAQRRSSDAVYDAIRRKDTAAAYRELGITPSSDPPTTRMEPAKPPTLQEQFDEHVAKLIAALKYVRLLPPDIIQARVEQVRAIQFFLPSMGLRTVEQMLAEYDTLYRRYEPRRDVWDLQLDQSIRFFDQMISVKLELEHLKQILTEAESKNLFSFRF